jgi:hypothetical protein
MVGQLVVVLLRTNEHNVVLPLVKVTRPVAPEGRPKAARVALEP